MTRSSKKTADEGSFFRVLDGNALVVFLLCIVIIAFDVSPFANDARMVFPANWHKGQSCYDILTARPWYGQINLWPWFWILSVPLIILSMEPHMQAWKRASRTLFIIALSYFVILAATVRHFDIINAPFRHLEITLDSNTTDIFKSDCYNNSDTGPRAFALLFGWAPALIYAGWWEIAWYQYHKRKTKLIDKNFKMDWVSKTVVFTSIVVPLCIVIWIVWRVIAT